MLCITRLDIARLDSPLFIIIFPLHSCNTSFMFVGLLHSCNFVITIALLHFIRDGDSRSLTNILQLGVHFPAVHSIFPQPTSNFLAPLQFLRANCMIHSRPLFTLPGWPGCSSHIVPQSLKNPCRLSLFVNITHPGSHKVTIRQRNTTSSVAMYIVLTLTTTTIPTTSTTT